MKRIFVILLCCVWYGASYGATFCAKSDKIVLGASVLNRPTATTSTGFDWSAYIPEFGTIRGVSSCSTLKADSSVNLHGCDTGSGYNRTSASNGDVNDNYYTRNDGNLCWCKMTHPFESGWVSTHLYGASGMLCEVECAIACAGHLKDTRNGYFASLFRCMLATVGLND